jgi:citrate lyase beta subunit
MANQLKSLIFVPATDRFLSKLKGTAAEAVIFDLEDSIVENEKEKALQILEQYLTNNPLKVKTYIRINRDRETAELARLAKYKFDGYMIPKFESTSFIDNNKAVIGNREIIALIETPKGLVKIEDVVSNEAVTAIAFGAEDYTCTVNMKNDLTTLSYAKSRIVMYASAYQKFAYDTPSFNYKDLKKFEADVEVSGDMGFSGKLAIHPDQVPIINKVFNHHNYAYIQYIIEQFRLSNTGVLKLDGRIYEKPHIEHLKKIIANRSIL